MYKMEFYVPQTHLEIVKEALFAAGAGIFGEYDQCCWQIEGGGQFRPSQKSDPHLGEKGKLEKLKEWKVELICSDECISSTLKALLHSHPYEEPAYNIVKCLDKSMFL